MKKHLLKNKVHKLLRQYYKITQLEKKFIPGKHKVRYSGSFYGSEELIQMTDTMLGGWFGLGIKGDMLEKALSLYIGSNSTLLTNSGSSASLLCMASITSDLYSDRIEKGAEIITPACTFATTAAAIVHMGMTPVFTDIDLGTYNPNIQMIEEAITPITRAIFIPHTLGNPNEMEKIMKVAQKHKLLVIEDNCDALGSEYDGKKTGSFGILATCSFYPAHHITMAGEGGAVFINDPRLHRVILSFRNWGRGCWCTSLEKDRNGACRNRFNFKIDDIPIDHKYLFLTLGFNLKPVEIQAAMGLAQLHRFPTMASARRRNFAQLLRFFKTYENLFILPRSLPKANPCWFSFPLTIRDKVTFTRSQITQYLERHLIETRTVFAGNIVRQPALRRVKYKISNLLTNSDKVLKDTFFIGIGPHITYSHLQYIQETFDAFLSRHSRSN